MELSVLTLRVVLLFFPGVLCALVVYALTIQRDRTTPQFLTSAFVYGVSTYLLLAALRGVCARAASLLGWGAPPRVTFFNVLTNEKARIAWGEIGLSALVALLLAFVVAVALNNNVLHKAAERIGISRRFGEVDVWGYFFNSPQIQWVAVRDLATDTVYEGWVEAFSDTGSAPEVLLRDVTVKTNSTGTKLFESKRVYLARDKASLIIEQL
jgi:hypothetical protein